MIKYSIIIPIYKIEKYIEKCLDSIFSQTYQNFEVICVNDGSPDGSIELVKRYDVKILEQKNQGQSVARNEGVNIATGDYLLFLDGDDYYEKDLLQQLTESIHKNKPDIVRFQAKEVFDNSDKILEHPEVPFYNKTGEEAFTMITTYDIVDVPWAYAFNRKFYLKNKFSFAPGRIHEDFGLIPFVIRKANKVNAIDYIGYNYMQRPQSTMSTKNYLKIQKGVEDFFVQYLALMNKASLLDGDTTVYKSFISNSMIIKITELNKSDYKIYLKKLKENHVFDYLLVDNLKRRIKKYCVKLSPRIYRKITRR